MCVCECVCTLNSYMYRSITFIVGTELAITIIIEAHSPDIIHHSDYFLTLLEVVLEVVGVLEVSTQTAGLSEVVIVGV